MTDKLLPTEITLHQKSHNLEVAFNDGETLYKLGKDYESNWQRYLERLEEAGHERPGAGRLQ